MQEKAKTADYNIHAVYSATRNVPQDTLRAFAGILGYKHFEEVKLLNKKIKPFLNKDPKNEVLLEAHSRGAIFSKNTIEPCEPELQNRISYLGIAPAAYISKMHFKDVTHLTGKYDLVTRIDFIGIIRCRSSIITLEPHKNAKGMDHDNCSETYRGLRELKIKTFFDDK